MFLATIGTRDDMWRMTRLLTGDDDTQMTDGWQTLQNRQKLQLWNLTLSKMTAWPKKAQIIADFINCTIASSAVTMVIFQVQNHVVMLRYVIATRLDVAHTSMPSLSGSVVWPNIMLLCCFSSSLEDLHLLSSMMLGDGGSCTTTPRNSRWIDENNHIIANIRWARFPIASELTNNQSGN